MLHFNSYLIFKIPDIKELMQEQGYNNMIVTSAHRDVLRRNSQDNTSKNGPYYRCSKLGPHRTVP